MSFDILEGDKGACFFCNTTDVVFGPLMTDYDEAEAFEKWLPNNPRSYVPSHLVEKFAEWKLSLVNRQFVPKEKS